MLECQIVLTVISRDNESNDYTERYQINKFNIQDRYFSQFTDDDISCNLLSMDYDTSSLTSDYLISLRYSPALDERKVISLISRMIVNIERDQLCNVKGHAEQIYKKRKVL